MRVLIHPGRIPQHAFGVSQAFYGGLRDIPEGFGLKFPQIQTKDDLCSQ
jgi:hypothetical protein